MLVKLASLSAIKNSRWKQEGKMQDRLFIGRKYKWDREEGRS